ncbi:MAG: phosphoribosylglycinamide formyltransferase [Chitinophagaceae bacterium]|nr:phosphoribosylglycinamide formyltransferase [Chitinophagaceae bacterium]
MFNKLKQRWRVNELQLLLIISTFALGGSLCGYLGKKILSFTDLEKGILWVGIYIILVSLLWPICVLLISIPFGQFNFFKNYLVKIGQRITGKNHPATRIAIFASGAGSNAHKIIETFKSSSSVKIALIVCNKKGAGVLSIAAKEKIPTLLIEKKRFYEGDAYLQELSRHQIDFIVLAGFLWQVPLALISQYPNNIINIHPALLPKYGGKGMYGAKVHEAVIAANEKESGITIHYVDEIYDHGNIIFQGTCRVDENDTPEILAQKIHILEHRHYPEVIARLLQIPK